MFYQSLDGVVNVDVKLEDEIAWFTQSQMAELFQKNSSTISEHMNNVFDEGELVREHSMHKFGNSEKSLIKPTNFYNLDVIISVGYRVKSHRGTQFRIWATQKLREYIVKWFAMDDERLANGSSLNGKNYFDELNERIRKIRSSERNFYEKVRDVFATSVDTIL